jgi:hypothetical protein
MKHPPALIDWVKHKARRVELVYIWAIKRVQKHIDVLIDTGRAKIYASCMC